jgi:hypothetical protein
MKHLLYFATTIIIPLLLSCKKNASSAKDNSGLFGKWNIQSDSSFEGVGLNNHPVTYVGQSGDYFDFNPGGKLFVEENGKSEELNYSITSDSVIVIHSFLSNASGAPDSCKITDMTNNNVVISAAILVTPGGIFGRKVHLTR